MDGTWREAQIWLTVACGFTFAAILLSFATKGPSLLGPAYGIAVLIMLGHAAATFVRVAVGADGLRISRPFRRSRFVPFGLIEDARADGRDLRIRTSSGQPLVMHSARLNGRALTHEQQLALEGTKLVARIREQLAAHRSREADGTPALARAGRTTSEWLRDLANAAAAPPSYRQPATPNEALWRVIEDAAAPATARAGAAVTLRASLDEDDRARLRAVAEACAAPKLRVALETAAAEGEAGLHDALEELDDQQDPPRARALRNP